MELTAFAGTCRVGRSQRVSQPLKGVLVYQDERAAAEARAHHARPEHTRNGGRDLDHHVQLQAAYLIVVTQARMRGVQVRAEPVGVARAQRLCRREHTCVFGHYVPRAPQQGIGQPRAVAGQIVRRHIAQRAYLAGSVIRADQAPQ